jgi:hypothetical protein
LRVIFEVLEAAQKHKAHKGSWGGIFFQIPRDQQIGWLMINLIKIACNFLELSVIFNPQNLWENLL